MTAKKPPNTGDVVLDMIFEELDEMGLSSIDVATDADVGLTSIISWRRGKLSPRLCDVQKLAAAAGIVIQGVRQRGSPGPAREPKPISLAERAFNFAADAADDGARIERIVCDHKTLREWRAMIMYMNHAGNKLAELPIKIVALPLSDRPPLAGESIPTEPAVEPRCFYFEATKPNGRVVIYDDDYTDEAFK